MATLFYVGNSSDSEEDCDYEPPADVLSSEDEEPLPCSDDDKDIKKNSRNRKGNSKSFFKTETKTDDSNQLSKADDIKKKADNVYKSFLNEVSADMKDAKNECMSSGISCSESNNSSPIALNINKNSFISSSPNTPEIFVEPDKETPPVNRSFFSLSSNSPCNSNSSIEKSVPSSAAETCTAVKRKGLDSVLGNILNKKQKMTTLTKSLLDWKNFKKEEGIEEDLASYNRGKRGYIERKRFLERSDVRSFEIERDMRLTKRKTKKDI